MTRPTHDDINNWLKQRRDDVFAGMHTRMKACETLYHWPSLQGQTAKALGLNGLHPDFKPYLPPIAKIGVDVAVNNTFVGEAPIVEIELPAGKRSEETLRDRKEKLKHFCDLWLRQAEVYATETPFRDFGIKGYSQGLGVLSYPFIVERWPKHPLIGANGKPRVPRNRKEKKLVEEWQAKRHRSFPWDVRSCSPTHVYFDPDHDPPLDMIEAYAVRRPDTGKAELGVRPLGGVTTGTSSGGQYIERVVYVSEEWYAVYDGGEPRLTAADGADSEGVARNPLGRLWYKMAWAGFGDMTSDGDWAAKGKGLLWDILPVVQAYTIMLNMTLVAAVMSSRVPLHITGPTDQDATTAAERLIYGPDAVWATGPGYDVDAFPQVPMPTQVQWVHEELNAILELWFGPNIMRGQHTEDTASGLRTRYAHAKAIYRAMTQNGAQAIAAMLMDVLWMIKHHIEDEITVWGDNDIATIGPDDIDDGLWITIDLTPPSAEEKAFDVQEASRRYAEHTSPLLTMLERAREPEPSKMVKEILKDAIRFHPMVIDTLAQVMQQRLLKRAEALGVTQQATQANEGQMIPEAAQAPVSTGLGEGQNTMPGLTLAGEQPPPAVMGSPADMANIQPMNSQMPVLAGAAPR
mgnify:CR=1 FL=1